MEEVVEYIIVWTTLSNIEEFQHKVNHAVKNGFQPYGSLVTTTGNTAAWLMQPMVRRRLTW